MENMSKEKLLKIKDGLIFILLFLWFLMPAFQTIKWINNIIKIREIYFNLMKFTGIIGISLSIIYIYAKIKKAENKKDVLKELIPIFLFVVYMIWTLISCIFSPDRYRAFYGNYYRQEGYFMYLNYAGYFLCAFLLENKKLRKILLNTFIIVSLFLIIITRISLINETINNMFLKNNVETAVFAQFNHYGYYLMMSLICSLGLFITEKNKVLKILYLLIYTVIGYGLIYNNTFGCYLATAIILILYGIYSLIKKKDRKLIFSAIIIFVILSCITIKNNENLALNNIKSFGHDIVTIVLKITGIEIDGLDKETIDKEFENTGTSRMVLWTNGIKFILERPILGFGPDNLRMKYYELSISHDRPHNLLIQLATTSGIPGMLIYINAVGVIIIRGIKKLLKNDENGKIFLIIIITYLISSMFGNSMYYTSPYFFIFLGSLMNSNMKRKEE